MQRYSINGSAAGSAMAEPGQVVVTEYIRRTTIDQWTPGRALAWGWKRSLDVVLTLLLLTVLSPVMLAAAIAIRIDSPGPILFRQKRVGSRRIVKGGKVWWEPRPFRIFKFRSMFDNADERLHRQYVESWVRGEVAEQDDSKLKFKLNGDPRVTAVGRFLRRTSLDELPQLFNILRGEMSLVGPRPVPEYEVAEYRPQEYERLGALPGITGYWQVYGRGRVSFDEMMAMDIRYVRAESPRLDLKLLILTIPAVLNGEGAG